MAKLKRWFDSFSTKIQCLCAYRIQIQTNQTSNKKKPCNQVLPNHSQPTKNEKKKQE